MDLCHSLGKRGIVVHCCGKASEKEGKEIRMSVPLFQADTNLLLDQTSPFCS